MSNRKTNTNCDTQHQKPLERHKCQTVKWSPEGRLHTRMVFSSAVWQMYDLLIDNGFLLGCLADIVDVPDFFSFELCYPCLSFSLLLRLQILLLQLLPQLFLFLLHLILLTSPNLSQINGFKYWGTIWKSVRFTELYARLYQTKFTIYLFQINTLFFAQAAGRTPMLQ